MIEDHYQNKQVLIISRVTSLVFFISIVMTINAYIPPYRLFGFSPIISIFNATYQYIIVLSLSLLSLVGLIIKPYNTYFAIVLTLCTLLFTSQDLLLFQPYTYLCCSTILFCAFSGKLPFNAINALRIMIIGLYLWAGFHKINLTFYLNIFPNFISGLHLLPNKYPLIEIIVFCMDIIAPFFELGIGILLLFPRHRKKASIMAFVMLVTVLGCLGPFGSSWNKVVWPWNMWLFFMEITLFYGKYNQQPISFYDTKSAYLSIALFIVAPCLAIFSSVYSFNGFKLYSGNIKTAFVIFDKTEDLASLPPSIRNLVTKDNELSLLTWSEKELNIIVLPDDYVFIRGAKPLCSYLTKKDTAKLRIFLPPPFYSTKTTFYDTPLCKP